MRKGTKSIEASEEIYQDLINSNVSPSDKLITLKGMTVTIKSNKFILGQTVFSQTELHRLSEYECRIEEANAFFVRLYIFDTDKYASEPIRNITISYDEENNRPLLIVRRDFP